MAGYCIESLMDGARSTIKTLHISLSITDHSEPATGTATAAAGAGEGAGSDS
eukprot:COSAG06_NODE_36919_length_441_cov_1.143275_2_plen_51_part_01